MVSDISVIRRQFAFFVISSIAFSQSGGAGFAPNTWPYRWFLLDGWLGSLYFIGGFDVSPLGIVCSSLNHACFFPLQSSVCRDRLGLATNGPQHASCRKCGQAARETETGPSSFD